MKKFYSFARIVVALIGATSVVFAEPVRYDISDWCLSYDPTLWPEGAMDVTIPGGFPAFLIPSSLATLSDTDRPSDTGLIVYFSKGSTLDWEGRVSGENYYKSGCSRVAGPANLIETIADGTKPCLQGPQFQYFEAADNSEADAATWMRCSINPSVLACRLTDIYRSGWRVSISLPKSEFEQWAVATAEARDFFDQHVTDCGE